MQSVYKTLLDVLAGGEDAVLVTILSSAGSVPRGAGAAMAVTKAGRIAGTVGGGAVEHRCELEAGEVLECRQSRQETYPLHQSETGNLGMVCGGEVTVEFRFLPGGDREALAWVEAERQRLKPTGRVYIFGGGHVAQALVPALAAVDFRCVVLEDRPELCRPERFPGVEETVLADFSRVEDFVTLTAEDWAVIMTRGHQDDLLVQAQVMKTPVRYIGVIGSKQKTATLTAKLLDMGFTRRDFARVCAPIGLPIRSETPAEIAVSITAQLILDRAGGLFGGMEDEADPH